MDDKLEEKRRKTELEYEIEKRKKEEDYDRKMKEMDLEIKRAMLEKLKPKTKKGKKVITEEEEVEAGSEALKENDPKTYIEVEKAIKSIIPTGVKTRPPGYGGSVREKIGRGLYSQKLKN